MVNIETGRANIWGLINYVGNVQNGSWARMGWMPLAATIATHCHSAALIWSTPATVRRIR